jgi:hypothetical protein
MTEEQKAWVQTQLQQLAERVPAYPNNLQPLAKALFLPKIQANFPAFRILIEDLLTALPPSEGITAASFNQYVKALRRFKQSVQRTYGLVPKGYYTRIWLPLGVAIGSSYGVVLKNIALGIPIGLAIGIAIGAGLDKKQKRKIG